ncbi:2-oxoglutarate and iron-dependent oxygenase domain-containing protein [Marivita sp. GX14005]|uniref:isopenicillin N synthase family dioxygenase n=1 Tax=Marivita sp. GX14005 TaxID=2942276 RepID=UPI00201892D0|nr:2-oxoglutarate and iron-dependent oxygenase domain-containing protein [Marivita sp. GX14005]MCL3882737.1 isopenicillin N synthase family oxygenase [Marivita sp. GX14005]
MIPRLDMQALAAGDPPTLREMRRAAEEIGFAVLFNTPLSAARIRFVLAAYGAFFAQPAEVKAQVDMARTGSNRGWGAPGSEQVDPEANPDYKEVFDCGFALPPGDPRAALPVYAPNHWPVRPVGFEPVIRAYYDDALIVARGVLRGIALSIGADADYFEGKFDCPMALLRGNYYPPRPDWAGGRDFGIAAHTDYGCLTLLATDGQAGLEVKPRGQEGWLPLQAAPGEFIINFGEMLEMWTGGRVVATLHRVTGGAGERISVPLFFNPNVDTNVAPEGDAPISAGDHLARRYGETYLHLKGRT